MDCINVGGQRALLGAKGLAALALVVDLVPLGDKGLAPVGAKGLRRPNFWVPATGTKKCV